MNTNHFHFLVAVHAFFIKDDQVLLLKRFNTGYMDGYFSVPAGHVDGGEGIADAMKREILEEVGVTVPADLTPNHVMHRIVSETEERIDYFFVIGDWEGEIRIAEPEKCSELKWVATNNVPENTIPYVKFALEKSLQGSLFSEFQI